MALWVLWAVVMTFYVRQLSHNWRCSVSYSSCQIPGHLNPQVWQVHISLDTDKHVKMVQEMAAQLKWKLGLGISRSWIGQAIRWQSQGLQCRAEESRFEPLASEPFEGLEMLNRLIGIITIHCVGRKFYSMSIVWDFGRNVLKHFKNWLIDHCLIVSSCD